MTPPPPGSSPTPEPAGDQQQELLRALACAALSPGLRTIIVFNAQPDALETLGAALSEMLALTTGRKVDTIRLTTVESDDHLWSRIEAHHDGGQVTFRYRPGMVARSDHRERLPLFVIPDLSRISLAVARACVTLAATEVANLERHGLQHRWRPDACWLAGCPADAAGRISAHLLDRFALRLSDPGQPPAAGRSADVLAWATAAGFTSRPHLALDQALVSAVASARSRRAQMSAEATDRVLGHFTPTDQHSARREIALARLSLAQARLEGASRATAAHVDAAARMIGLRSPGGTEREASDALQERGRGGDAGAAVGMGGTGSLEVVPQGRAAAGSVEAEVEDATALPDTAIAGVAAAPDPYPEDQAPIEHEAASLRLPPRRHWSPTAARGPVVGVRQASGLEDLALLDTLLVGAKFQPIRRHHRQPANGRTLLLAPSDLRSYVRAPVPDAMLAVVLDLTCLKGWDWQAALEPYLRWAYVERASVCLVQVGVDQGELQARRIVGRSLLDPRIDAALEATPGRATPLAHGLDLAFQTLQHALQHGEGVVRQAWLVLLTDGRGNVPLGASRTGQLTPPVSRHGVDDTIRVAHRIRALNQVRSVLLNPEPQHHADLPLRLAEALGATVVQRRTEQAQWTG
jgi:magnesium chelatase subunit D